MATMLKVRKEGGELTPEEIQGKLFSLADIAHKFHLDTKLFAEHKALDELYKGLVDFKDDTSEKLMGYLGGKRIGKIKLEEIPEYSPAAAKDLAEEVKDFGYELYEWAAKKKFCDIENIAQALSGLGADIIYKLTLN